MRRQQNADVNQIYTRLHDMVRYGVRANALYEHGRQLIDLLVPSGDDTTDESYSRRALLTEAIIRKGIEQESASDATALRITLGVDSETSALRKLETRRREAARLYGVLPNTYRMRQEHTLLRNLAFQILTLIICAETPKQSDPPGTCACKSPPATP